MTKVPNVLDSLSQTCILSSFLGMHPCSCMAYLAPKFINQCNYTFGGLVDFLSANPLNVKNVNAEYSAIENWEKDKTGKLHNDDFDIASRASFSMRRR